MLKPEGIEWICKSVRFVSTEDGLLIEDNNTKDRVIIDADGEESDLLVSFIQTVHRSRMQSLPAAGGD